MASEHIKHWETNDEKFKNDIQVSILSEIYNKYK
jgi:hypothetical protein